jgi:epoxyqueuosine reductase
MAAKRETSAPPPRPPDSPESLVKRAALASGFSLVGIAGASASPRSTDAFERWVAGGNHAEMKCLSGGAAKRRNPALLLEGAKSVVTVAVNYYSPEKERWNREAAREGRGETAIYAHGRDYHDGMGEMLTDLRRRLENLFPGIAARTMVDTEPISERDFAARSGIAWLGKNTCAISPEYGSWILLGELITDLALDPDQPLESLCGRCTRCVDSCPTGALSEFVLDANKCISYLTIEKRGDIPREFHRPIGRNLFGCDECQRVCPFNKAARESVVFPADERNGIVKMALEDLRVIPDEMFKELARGTAIARCKASGIRRNAAIVIENAGRGGADELAT